MPTEAIAELSEIEYNPDHSVLYPPEMALSMPLMDLDMIFSVLYEEMPNKIEIIVQKLLNKLEPHLAERNYSISHFRYEYQTLSDSAELNRAHKQAVLSLMNFERYSQKIKDEKVLFRFDDALRSVWYVWYYVAEILVNLLGRKNGLDLVRQIAHLRVKKWFGKNYPHPEDLNHMFLEQSKMQTSFVSGCIALLEDGRFCQKTEQCYVYDMFCDFVDPEIANAAFCHSDYALIPHMNENFVLTRTRTLLNRDNYCDYCIHDKRVRPKLIHPEDNFWENL